MKKKAFCAVCEKPLSNIKYSYCAKHVPKSGSNNPNYKGIQDRKCLDCETKISAESTGRCKTCAYKFFKAERHGRFKGGKERQYKRNTEYQINRYRIDPSFRLRKLLRSRIHGVLKGKIKNGSAIRDLGCSVEELRCYLESKFQSGMSWDNHGAWHIDHIIPLSKFDLTDSEQLKIACHFSNLQPLWALDNITKGAKLETRCHGS